MNYHDGDLFLKIFRNKYLKNLMFHHLRLYNNNYHVQAFTIESLSKYEYKEYLRWVLIKDYKDQDDKLMCKLLNSLPNIQVLESEKEYNQTLPNISISQTNIKKIKFGENFDQPLLMYALPMKNVQHSLTSLTMGNSFNQPIDTFNQLVNLKTLVFGNFFNQPIKVGQLPQSITLLQFGHAYNQKMSYGSLPINLEILKLGPLMNKVLFQKKPKKTKNSLLFNI